MPVYNGLFGFKNCILVSDSLVNVGAQAVVGALAETNEERAQAFIIDLVAVQEHACFLVAWT